MDKTTTRERETVWEQWRGYVVFAIVMFFLGAFCAWALQWVPLEYKDGERSSEGQVDN